MNVLVNDPSISKTTVTPAEICPGQSSNLSGSVISGSVKWYTDSTGGTLLDSSLSEEVYIVTPTGTTTYYVEGVAQEDTQTFNYTGSVQTWTVPQGVTSIEIDAYGGKGGSDDANWAVGGKGGRVQATMSVTPGQVLNIYVGGKGDNYGNGGYNGGGGRAVSPAYRSGGGGGATDIRIGGSALSDRVLVAGGGGGYQNRGVGGAGGGLTGVAGGQDYITSGYVPSGQGGTQTAGGARGGIVVYTTNKATAGTFGIGGKSDHDYSLYCYTCETWGGAGGGGWYGGGGTCNGSGGGGGSSYANPSLCSNVIHTRGVRSDKGLLVISYNKSCGSSSTRIPVTVTVKQTTTATISPSVCDSYSSPSGKVWTTTGNYMDTIPNDANCDSIIIVNLKVRHKTFETINPDVCDSYTSPSGKTWTTSNTYLDTIPNNAGCDSVITVNLMVRYKSFATINPDVCDSYVSPSGKTWTVSNTYMDTIPNDANCDSIITVNLVVRYKSFFTFAETAYETYSSPSGKTWTNTGTYVDTIPNDANCDSIITIELTIVNKLFVDTDGSGGSGKSWGNSMKTLDDAISAANKTDNHAEIWMRKGMYYPGGKSSSNRDSAFVVTNPNFELLGGFSGTETEPGQRNQTANPTILCGDIGTTNDSSDNVYHVLIIAPNGSDIGPNFKLDGLTFKNGNADGSTKYTYENRDVYQSEGGSIVILGSGKSGQEISPTITNCHFEGNYGDYGSIYISVPGGKSFATISHCTFKNNYSIYGAIYNDGRGGEVSPNIVNCAFDGNTSATSGAAIYNYGYGGKASPTITSCVFNNNTAASVGGAICNNGYAGQSNPVITNCTFYDNDGGTSAGAMYNFGNAGTCQPKVTNSIFYKNTKGGDADHKFSEFYNYAAYPYVKNSSTATC